MSSYDAALALVDKLESAGIVATVDPRSATPPCVLVPPPDREYVGVMCGYVARWRLWALVPGTGNADAHKALDALVDKVADVLPVERMAVASYVLANDAPPLPAYRIEFDEGV